MISLAFDEDVSVTAGIGGFLVFFFLAIALWLLMRNMFARLRRMRYREEARVQAEEEELARRRGQSGDGAEEAVPGDVGDTDDTGGGPERDRPDGSSQ